MEEGQASPKIDCWGEELLGQGTSTSDPLGLRIGLDVRLPNLLPARMLGSTH